VAERDKLVAQFRIVVNFTVEDDGGIAVFTGDGLVSALNVDDAQTNCSQGNRIRTEGALLVRAPVNQAGNRTANPVVIRAKNLTRETSNSTHVRIQRSRFRLVIRRTSESRRASDL